MASVVNQWTLSAENTYGLQAVAVSPTPGNALIAFIGWNASGAVTNPVSGVADDANDWWVPLGTSSKSGNVRCAIWAAPNIRSGPGSNGGASVVSLALSWFALGICGLVVEMSGLPNFAQADFAAAAAYTNSGTTQSLSATAAVSDYAFTIMVSGNNTATITPPGGSWNALTTVSVNDGAGAGGTGDTKITPLWYAPSAGAVSASYSASAGIALASLLAGIKQSATAPIQPNANWPALKIEAAFGYTPGDPTVMPTWTDVSGKAFGAENEPVFRTSRGRAYELTQPEAGWQAIAFDNHDGTFTPGNSASSYYPNVLISVPVRISAVWSNVTYGVGAGYVERWPQEWPDMPQWGRSTMEAADSIGVLASTRIVSAYAGEVLTDSPYASFPCGEFYPAGTTGNSGAQGLPLGNLSRTNQKPAICVNGVARSGSYPSGTGFTYHYLETGLALGLAGDTQTGLYVTVGGRRIVLVPTKNTVLTGDSGTGIGISSLSSHASPALPGALYSDVNLPQPSGGITVEFWAILPTTMNTTDQITLLRVVGPGHNYFSNVYPGGDRLEVFAFPSATTPQITAVTADYLGNYTTFSDSTTIANGDGKLHHYAVTVSVSGGNYSVALFIDGVKVKTGTSSGVTVTSDWQRLYIGPVMPPYGGPATAFTGWNYTIAHAAYYGSVLPDARIAAHYSAGNTAYSGDTAAQRVARLMTWGGYGFARASDLGSPSPLLGPADQVQGQSVAQAAYDLTTNEGGMFYCDAAGNATYRSRTSLYNRTAKYTFGDSTAGGEIPYDTKASFGYDNSFIQNVATSQRSSSSTNFGGSYTAADTTSQQQYLVRGPLQQNVETTSEQDPQDRANWSLQKYKQPSLRVQQIVIEPSSYPTAWPAALGVEQGDVVTVNRRPLGGATISQTCIVQKISHDVTPTSWRTTIIAVPYTPENAVLVSDSGQTVGSSALPW